MIGGDSDIVGIARAMLSHAAERQAVAAGNIAQADTPGYRAKDVQDFAEMFAAGDTPRVTVDVNAPVKPNGNSVSLEQQVMNLAEARGQHELALGLYDRTLSLYRQALGRAS